MIHEKLIHFEGLNDIKARVGLNFRSNEVKGDLFFYKILSKDRPITITEEVRIGLIICKAIGRDIVIQDFNVITRTWNTNIGKGSIGCFMKSLFKVILKRSRTVEMPIINIIEVHSLKNHILAITGSHNTE
jgi:hypothetical protein